MPSILSTKPSTPHDEVESDNFEPTHNWGWKDWQHWLVDKESGQPTEVTMKGIVAYSSLNLWSNMGSNESMDIWRLGQQSITLRAPSYLEPTQSYERAVTSLSNLMSLASERWPTDGFVTQWPRFGTVFRHQAFEDRRGDADDVRAKHRQNFTIAMETYDPPAEARAALVEQFSHTHSVEVLRVDYQHLMLLPKIWDDTLVGSLVKVTFKLSHKYDQYKTVGEHTLEAHLNHVEIIEPAQHIDPENCFNSTISRFD